MVDMLKAEKIYADWQEHINLNLSKESKKHVRWNRSNQDLDQLVDWSHIKTVVEICEKYNLSFSRFISIVLMNRSLEPPLYWNVLASPNTIRFIEEYFHNFKTIMNQGNSKYVDIFKSYIRDLVNQGVPLEDAKQIVMKLHGIINE